MVRSLCIALLLIFSAATFSQAQSETDQRNPAERKVFRVDVNLVQMDVVVTDSKGRHVTDLTADDFTVIQDFKPREITNFSLVRVPDRVPASKTVYPAVAQDPDGPPPPPTPAREYKASQVRRTIALVVDDLGISFEGLHWVKESLKDWVNKEMQPGDLVALILTSKGAGTLQQFTTDKRVLHEAIGKIFYNISGRVGSHYCVDNTVEVSSNLLGDLGSIPSGGEHRRHLTLASLGSIQYVLGGLKNLSGRKSMILFTEDLWMIFDEGSDTTVQEKMQRLIKDANSAAVVIHTIDSRGLVVESDDGCSQDDIIYAQDGMMTLARETGGLFEHSRNDIDGALFETVRDGETYYLIGYQPDEELAREMREGKPKFHDIQVRVNRPGLHVRTRSGFLGTPDSQSEPVTQREELEHALYSPFAAGDLPMRLTPLFSQTNAGEPRITALLHFDVDKLDFSEDSDGWQNAEVEMMAALFDIDGQQLEFADEKVSLTARGETFNEIMKNGVIFHMGVPAKKDGAYQLRVILTDTRSGLMGSAMEFVKVPDLGTGRLAISGIALAAERSPLGIEDGPKEGLIEDREVNGSTAVRIFKSGEKISWGYQVLNAKTGKDKKSNLQTYVRLFREGREVYAAETAEISLEQGENSGRMIGIGQMELNRIAPGDYILQVVVRDMLAKEKERTAVQSIHFQVLSPKLAAVR